MKELLKKFISVIITMTVIFIALSFSFTAFCSTSTVRVAYFNCAEYYKQNANGSISSYDTDYLNKIEEYSSLNFEYIDCKTWANALKMLKNHEIDLVGTMQYSDERKTNYDICDRSYGYTVSQIVSLPGKNYVFEDYEEIGNSTLGCLYDFPQKNKLDELFSYHKISPQLKYYDTQEALLNALEKGEINLAAGGAHTFKEEYKVVAKFAYSNFYFATWKGNDKLKSTIDDALIKISINEPQFDDASTEKYLKGIMKAPYTTQEINCINKHNTYTLYFDDDLKPLSWYEKSDSTMKGAYIDICKEISAVTGLIFKYRPLSQAYEAKKETDVFYETYLHDTGKSPNINNGQTNSVTNTDFELYHRVGSSFDINTKNETHNVAILKNCNAMLDYLKINYPKWKIIKYDNTKKCIESLKNKTTDYALLNTYAASSVLIHDNIDDVATVFGKIESFGINLKFEANDKKLLASIVNKALVRINPDKINDIMTGYAVSMVPNITATYIVGKYAWFFLIILILLIILCLASIMLYHKAKKAHIETEELLEQMHEAQRRMETMLSNTPGGLAVYIVKDNQMMCDYISEQAASIHGETVETVKKRFEEDILYFIHPQDKPHIKEKIENAIKNGLTLSGQYRIMKKDGTVLWISIFSNPYKQEDGSVKYYCAYTDVTELRTLNEKLLNQKHNIDFMLRFGNISVWNYDLENDSCVWESTPPWKGDDIEGQLPEDYIVKNTSKVGETFLNVSCESINEYENIFKRMKNGENVINTRLKFRTPHGDEKWKQIIYITKFKDNSPIGATGYSIDITDTVRDEQLYQNEIRYLEEVHSEDLLEKGQVNLTNNRLDSYSSYFGYDMCTPGITFTNALENLADQMVMEDNSKDVKEKFSIKALQSAFNLGTKELSMNYLRQLFKDRPPMWCRLTIKMFINRETNELNGFLYSYNINEETIVSNIVNKLFDIDYNAVALIDIIGNKLRPLKKDKLESLYDAEVPEYGFSYNEFIQDTIQSYFLPEDHETAINSLNIKTICERLKTVSKYSVSFNINRNKKIRRMRWDFIALNSTATVIIYTRTDVTELYEKEALQNHRLAEALKEAEKANKAKAEFLNTMSHDIRTPMNAIVNLTQMIREDTRDLNSQSITENLNKLEASSQFLKGLINDILDVSRIESGKMHLSPEVYEYPEFINYICSIFEPLCKNKDITFICEKGPSSLPIYVDKVRFNQLFTNLISNAVKYTPNGGTVKLRTYGNKITNGILTCKYDIIDTGCGMSNEFQKKMFIPFERETRVISENEGTGLGLSIVKSIIDLMGAKIHVNSEIGKGTTITVEMAVKIATEEQIKNNFRKKLLPDNMNLIEGMHILIAEDNTVNVTVLKHILNKQNITADSANNGKVALETFQKSQPGTYDAILMDVRMPVMDGIEATKQIRLLKRSDAKTVPIIAVTADVFSEKQDLFKICGMSDCIYKPIDPNNLYKTLFKHSTSKRKLQSDKTDIISNEISDSPSNDSRLLKALENFGCTNLKMTIERFVNDMRFYKEMLIEILNDENFDKLSEQLCKNEADKAFLTAHTLKGAIGNTGITPMYELIIKIVEPLRSGKTNDLLPYVTELNSMRRELTQIIEKL